MADMPGDDDDQQNQNDDVLAEEVGAVGGDDRSAGPSRMGIEHIDFVEGACFKMQIRTLLRVLVAPHFFEDGSNQASCVLVIKIAGGKYRIYAMQHCTYNGHFLLFVLRHQPLETFRNLD